MAQLQQEIESVLAVDRSDVLKLHPAPATRGARHGSLQPQENDDDDDDDKEPASDHKEPPAIAVASSNPLPGCRRLSDRRQVKRATITSCVSLAREDTDEPIVTSTTLLPELELICALTRRITFKLQHEDCTQQELEDWEDQDDDDDEASLASLYCRRAKTLLQYVNFDASTRIPLALLDTLDPGLSDSDTQFLACDELCAVQQALVDALVATKIDGRLVDAFYVAAQSARSLGKTEEAIEYVGCAMRLSPQWKKLHTLKRQLDKDLSMARVEIAPPLLCRSAPQVEELEEQQLEDPNDAVEEQDGLAAEIQERFQAMEALSDSALLLKLESMMHEALHHQCATTDEALALAEALRQTVELLRLLLGDSATTSRAVLLETNLLDDSARQLQSNPRALVESAQLRRWIVQVLTPAVVQSVPDHFGASFAYENVASAVLGCRAALLRDVLVSLSRLLLATGSLQHCTNEPNALVTIKLAYDLAKQLMDDPFQAALFVPLEMACTDTYALALLDFASESGEALLLHQETLEAAVQRQDRDHELRSRHMIGRALLRIREFEPARAQFSLLLQLSQSIGDSAIECLALYNLGACHVAVGDLEQGLRLFESALVLCNQTAQCRKAWRQGSIQHAIDFYACLRPPRRRRGVVVRATDATNEASSTKLRNATLSLLEQELGDGVWSEHCGEGDDHQDLYEPAKRRTAIWEASTQDVETPRKTLAETLVGDFGSQSSVSEAQAQARRTLARVGVYDLTAEGQPSELGGEGEPKSGPLTTHSVSLMSWLVEHSSTRPMLPVWCKPVE